MILSFCFMNIVRTKNTQARERRAKERTQILIQKLKEQKLLSDELEEKLAAYEG